jgi:hypothetical protein
MTIELLDPADADNFRMTKDFGRWYIDPLPADDIAPATEDQWPSFSQVGRAADQDWSFLVTPRMAAIEPDELRRIAGLERLKRLEEFRSHEKHAKQCAFGRGSIVHLWKEDLLAGRAPREITEAWLTTNKYPPAALIEAKAYLPAILDFFDVYQPEPVVVEYVTIHRTLNGHGYGATPDALVKIEGETVAVDWKTRSDGSAHAAYPKELKQVAAGVFAEYMIVRRDGEAVRQRIPEVSGGYVVSIKTDGARLYPLELDRGWEHFCHLHEWWTHTLNERDGIKRVLPARRKAAATPEPSRKDQLLARFEALTHDQKTDFKARRLRKGDLDAVEKAIDSIVSPTPARPDEGGDVDEADFAPMAAAYEALPGAAKKWCARLLAESRDGGVPFHRASAPTMRRYELYRGLIHLAGWADDPLEARDVLVALVYAASGADDSTLFANVTAGHALGSLNATEAATFSQLVDRLVGGTATLSVLPTGEMRVVAA